MAAGGGIGMDWEAALAYAENSTLAGYDDWRLPNVRELQSIVDYTHSPSADDESNKGPAIDTDFFEITEIAPGTTNYKPDYIYYWTSTSAYFNPGDPGIIMPGMWPSELRLIMKAVTCTMPEVCCLTQNTKAEHWAKEANVIINMSALCGDEKRLLPLFKPVT